MSNADKAVVRRFVEDYQTGHDVSVAEALLADDFVDHSPFGPLSPDRDGVLALFGMLVRVRDGKLTEHWNVVDALALMTQLGAIPAPA